MFLRRSASKVWLAVLILFLTACSNDGRLKLVVAPPSEPLVDKAQISTVQPAGALSTQMSPLATPTPVAPGSGGAAVSAIGKGGLVGRLLQFGTNKPLANQNLSLPAIVCPPNVAEKDKREQCIYVIDDAFDPSTLTDSEGRFVFQNIGAGEYILLIGNRVTRYTILTDELNQPLIWKVEADKVLDLGDLVVELR